MVFYALVEWDEDKSLSVVPVSKFLSRNAEKVKQKWGARVYAGTILQEGGKCQFLNGPRLCEMFALHRIATLPSCNAPATIQAAR